MRALILIALLSGCVPQPPPQSTAPIMSTPIPNPPERSAADKRLERVQKAIDEYLARTKPAPSPDEQP